MATDGFNFSSINPAKMLILMALPQESQGLIEKWAFEHGSSVVFTGMGMLKAARKTTQAILENRPDFILNIGTAGSRNHKVGTLVECTEIFRRDQVIDFLKKKISLTAISDLPKTNCGSADFIDTSENINDIGVVDMEAYAIASVCKEFNLNCVIVKYVTDSSGQNVKEQWESNTKAAATAFLQFLTAANFSKIN